LYSHLEIQHESLLEPCQDCGAVWGTADSHPLCSCIVLQHFVNGQETAQSLVLTIWSSHYTPSNALDSHLDCQKVYLIVGVSQEALQGLRQFDDRFVGEKGSIATKDCCYELKTSSQRE